MVERMVASAVRSARPGSDPQRAGQTPFVRSRLITWGLFARITGIGWIWISQDLVRIVHRRP